MKRLRSIAFFLFFSIIASCKNDDESTLNKKIDFDKESIKIMDTIRPNLLGLWKATEIKVRPSSAQTNEIGIVKDTILTDTLELRINSIDNSDQSAARNEVSGVLSFRSKNYPVGFTMHAAPERIVKKVGSPVIGLLEYRFPVGSHLTEPEESYLNNLLMNDNYYMEVSDDRQKMIWKGLNRAVESIKFVRQ